MTETLRPPVAAVGLEDQAIHWDAELSYTGYLRLGGLLALQQPRSKAHDELMFIIVHQASELWMKLAIHHDPGGLFVVSRRAGPELWIPVISVSSARVHVG